MVKLEDEKDDEDADDEEEDDDEDFDVEAEREIATKKTKYPGRKPDIFSRNGKSKVKEASLRLFHPKAIDI